MLVSILIRAVSPGFKIRLRRGERKDVDDHVSVST